jgi:hypothetical protein
MKQLNLNVTPEFERDLLQYMKIKEIATKSEAIRHVLHDAVAHRLDSDYDFRPWLGMGLKAPLRKKRRFRSEDELWS